MACVLEAYDLERSMMLQESLVSDASQGKQLIGPSFRLLRRPEIKSNLCIRRALVGLEGCEHCPDKQDAGERESIIQPLACVQMQKYGLSLSLIELLVAC